MEKSWSDYEKNLTELRNCMRFLRDQEREMEKEMAKLLSLDDHLDFDFYSIKGLKYIPIPKEGDEFYNKLEKDLANALSHLKSLDAWKNYSLLELKELADWIRNGRKRVI